jgi:putative Mg2+ transporter-C (MgtC) family protein
MELTLEQVTFRLIIALVLSSIIGLEREFMGKPAGMRTHALVGLGAAIMTVCGVLIAAAYNDADGTVSVDPTRLASVVIQGIGFIGAGVIIQARGAVKGLTSAATLWFAAALGISTGFGYWSVAVISTVMALLLLIVFRKFEEEAERLEFIRHSHNGDGTGKRRSNRKKT